MNMCGNDGHNSRSCKRGCTEIKLFGVQIAVDEDGSTIRRTKSLDNLQSCNTDAASAAAEPTGYLSDGFVHQSSKSNDRKRGKPWSEEEHVSFLAGLEKLGKGDWKGISNTFVPSRSSTQVASHAQKYFNRLSATERKRRRPSVFDIRPLTHLNQSSNKGDDQSSFQASSSTVAPKNVVEQKGQPSKAAPMPMVTTSERPPLSPMMNKRGIIPDYIPTMVYQQQTRVPSFTHGYLNPTQTTRSWPIPMVNFSGSLSSGFPPNIHAFVTHHQQQGSLASTALPTPNNDDLNLNIRKLTL